MSSHLFNEATGIMNKRIILRDQVTVYSIDTDRACIMVITSRAGNRVIKNRNLLKYVC